MSETDATDETATMPPFRVAIYERLDTLADSIATANRAAIAHADELRKLRRAIVVGFLAVLFYFHTRGLIN